ncbi:MAG TPA: hypothetical protein VFM53_05050 [Anaeromyxobacteraceae bacterium]|nr:hypothetical protein [Anaeromyxobacteraceae bacterium]
MRALLRLGPYALLAAVAAGLALAWDRLPARYAVHWGAGGVRFANLSVRTVAGPLLAGLAGVAWMGLLRGFILANSPPAPDPARARPLVGAITVAAQWNLALVFGSAAIPSTGPGLVLGAAGLGTMLVPAALVATYAGKAPGNAAAGATPVAPPGSGWLFQPRPDGTGLSIDLRHPLRWRALLLILAGPVSMLLAASLVR